MEKIEFKSFDGLKIQSFIQEPSGKPKAVIILVHGLGEHAGRYEHVADFFTAKQYVFIGSDLRGHGLSEGARGHAKSYRDISNDIGLIFNHANSKYQGIPKIIYGHSMGGNIALNFTMKHPSLIDLALISSPWIKLAKEPGKMTLLMAKIANSLFPGMKQANGLDVKDISRLPEEVEKYASDPLVHKWITPRLFTEINKKGECILKHSYLLTKPVLLLHGSDDHITSCDASYELSKECENLEFKLWNGGFHELHNDKEKAEYLEFVLAWLDEKLDALNEISD